MSYWLYQHIGNLSPPELAEEELLPARPARRGRGPAPARGGRDVGPRDRPHSRWAFYRDFGDSRLLVIDSRAARVLTTSAAR